MTTPFNLAAFANYLNASGQATPSTFSDQGNTSTGALGLPIGTTAQRPASPAAGYTRINSSTGVIETYYNNTWTTVYTFPPSGPTTIGESYGGGYYAGKISTTGNGVATHYLIVAPKATGEISGKNWGDGTATSITSVIDGPANTTALAAKGASFQAAVWCKALTIGGYTDWYLPAKNELEVLYYFLKPTNDANRTSPAVGSNANAVSPEPLNTNYTSGSPSRTSAAIFQSSGAQTFEQNYYWSSTEKTSTDAWAQTFFDGNQQGATTYYSIYTRAVRRIAI